MTWGVWLIGVVAGILLILIAVLIIRNLMGKLS